MPAEFLTDRPAAGFFGKLPATGDFVARGLPDAFRRNWDRWVSAHVAPRQRAGADWPAGGLRFRLRSGGRVAGGVIVASCDSAGRLFPLSLILAGDGLPGPAALDPWCDAAAALGNGLAPDALWQALDALPLPEGADGPPEALVVWTGGAAPVAADPADPAQAIDAFLGWSGA